jgi:hypothetical protein
MKSRIDKLDDVDVYVLDIPMNEQERLEFSAFIQKRKLQHAKRLASKKSKTA